MAFPRTTVIPTITDLYGMINRISIYIMDDCLIYEETVLSIDSPIRQNWMNETPENVKGINCWNAKRE